MLCIRPGRPVYYFMAIAEAMYMGAAGIIPQSYDVLCHPENLVFELSQLG